MAVRSDRVHAQNHFSRPVLQTKRRYRCGPQLGRPIKVVLVMDPTLVQRRHDVPRVDVDDDERAQCFSLQSCEGSPHAVHHLSTKCAHVSCDALPSSVNVLNPQIRGHCA